MTEKLSWQEFRSIHTGIKKELKSLMWNAYKKQDAQQYLEAVESAGIETPEEVKAYLKISDTDGDGDVDIDDVDESDDAAMYREYAKLQQHLHRFPHAYNAVQKKEMQARLVEIAESTRPHNYKCSATDGWQIWFGPTQQCLLINTSKNLAFTCSRGWWQRRYLNAQYVDRQLVHDKEQIARMRAQYEIRKKLIKRAPLPDVEIMVPTTASDYQMRG